MTDSEDQYAIERKAKEDQEREIEERRKAYALASLSKPKDMAEEDEAPILELPDDVTDIKELAKLATPGALRTLYQVALAGKSEAARVSAAMALLDRAHGKPSQGIDISGKLTLGQLVEMSMKKADVIDGDSEEVPV